MRVYCTLDHATHHSVSLRGGWLVQAPVPQVTDRQFQYHITAHLNNKLGFMAILWEVASLLIQPIVFCYSNVLDLWRVGAVRMSRLDRLNCDQ